METDIKVRNIETFLRQLPRLNKKMEGNIFYRGQSDVAYKLTPSVFREHNKCHEHEIYTYILTECAHEFDDCKLHNEILSKMQHYGVPTRLLDVTTNALVALYFACDSNFDKDGVVFVLETFKSEIKQYDSDAISILSCLPRFDESNRMDILKLAMEAIKEKKEEKIKYFNEQAIIKRLLHEIKKEKPAFENIINPQNLLSNYYFLPRKINPRIIRQSGAFIIFGLQNEEIKADNSLPIDENSFGSYKIIVDKEKKKTIIDQLSCFGISKASLHPELYKVAEYIKEKYDSQIN